MTSFFHQLENSLSSESLFLQTLIVLAVAAILNVAVNYFLHYAKKASDATVNIWDDSLIKAAKLPATVLIWLIAAKLCSDILIVQFDKDGFAFILPMTKVAVIICFAWILLRFVNYATQAFVANNQSANSGFDHTNIDAFSKLARLSIVIFTLIIIMHNLGFNISGILAAGGAGGLVIGFAAKDLFANFFGGLTIYLDRPFNVGDWIRCDEKSIEGTVEYIGWRHTRLRGFNMNPIYVPNAVFTTVVVENPSRMSYRRIKEDISLRYSDIDKMDKITADIKKMLIQHDDIDNDRTMIVNFSKFNDSSLDFMIYTFTKTINWQEYCKIKQDILLKVAAIIEANKAEFAFPTRTLHISKTDE